MAQSIIARLAEAGPRLVQAVLILAALAAMVVTYNVISGADPSNPVARYWWLFLVNLALIVLLARMLVRRYGAMREGGPLEGGGRLARRFLLLFAASSVLPAFFVAIVLGGAITRGLDNWFDSRIGSVIEDSAAVAKARIDEVSESLENSARDMTVDVSAAAEGLRTDRSLYVEYLGIQSELRRYWMAFVLDAGRQPIASAMVEDAPAFVPPPDAAVEEADSGGVGLTLYEQTGFATALTRLQAPEGAYLYVYRTLNREDIARLRSAEQAVLDYRAAKTRSGRLQFLFAVGYAQIAALALLLFARLGLEAAGSVTRPIGRLAQAANTVRDGDLTVRVQEPSGRDEVAVLTRSFNTMTEQLAEQHNALLTSREVSEDRRRFLETLLSEISAGVIRTDDDLVVTLANRSALEILDLDSAQGASLRQAAPQFAEHAQASLSAGAPVDASVELVSDDGQRHIRLKAAPDAAGGCVLTFDDATRLISAQRQLAWRDVARRIAHEIRNPLTPIQLSAERLRRRYRHLAGDDEAFDRCIDTIMRQVADIGRMVETFSSFARMPKPVMAPFDLWKLLENAAFAQGMVSPDVDIRLSGDAPEGPYVGDERLLGQAFANLLKNAAEAIESLPADAQGEGAAIDVKVEPLEGGVIVQVEDNGPGFPSEARAQFLEPYVTTRERGSGLGLAIVNRIIIDHGGSVSLHDRTDRKRGAKVRVHLPNTPTEAGESVTGDDRVKEPA